mmetsp:Transcript_30598/g.55384  ORF Transcript_30598/g.55384 Transcript_30598/m.55384 type:complete len:203 (-) Transcript_30598:730-1338(-)
MLNKSDTFRPHVVQTTKKRHEWNLNESLGAIDIYNCSEFALSFMNALARKARDFLLHKGQFFNADDHIITSSIGIEAEINDTSTLYSSIKTRLHFVAIASIDFKLWRRKVIIVFFVRGIDHVKGKSCGNIRTIPCQGGSNKTGSVTSHGQTHRTESEAIAWQISFSFGNKIPAITNEVVNDNLTRKTIMKERSSCQASTVVG